jgi:urea carboxylase
MFDKVLIANRGAIACRILRTLTRLGIRSVAVYSEADRYSRHVASADEAFCLGPAPASESYLRQDRIIAAALASGAQAIHPGYGFLSENAEFASACEAAGLKFIGPTPAQMRDFGLKHRARELAQQHAVPLLPGSGLLDDAEHAARAATRIGYPVMLKSTAGGGGIGMRLCRNEVELLQAFPSVQRLAQANFRDGGVFLERYIEQARHIEVQIFGDGRGAVIALGERDCSLQRRHQKVIEETPAPGLTCATRENLWAAAVRLSAAVAYRSAGTVEFVYDVTTGLFYFLEMNTRLQVEHGVTEAITGVDLVEWMLLVAADESPPLATWVYAPLGHAIQARVYAEDPAKDFRPSSGRLTVVQWPTGVRVDTWIEPGTEVTPFYDPLLAKIICHADTREAALALLEQHLASTALRGIETNLSYLRRIVCDPTLHAAEQTTRYLSTLVFRPRSVEVLQPGTHTTLQDYPGRVGYWDVGVPPSGPMDALAFRMANRVLGNSERAAALELTVSGPTLRFGVDTMIALTGARMRATLDGEPIAYWQVVAVKAGSVLAMASIEGAGQRAYLAVQGGFEAMPYLGSRATFTLGGFGGDTGRALRAGDTLHLGAGDAVPTCLPTSLIPSYASAWDIAVTYGPHGAPEFFTPADIDMLFATAWRVHHNSSRTGVRLLGPKPQWARTDGGEAGLHPSNLHDNAYAIGSIDFTGDMPVILGPDGPSLGGFVCPAVVVQAERWKLGQLRPDDTVRFRCIDLDAAAALERAQEAMLATLIDGPNVPAIQVQPRDSHLALLEPTATRPRVCYRQAGDKYLLIEYGPAVLDLELRFRVHALMQWLEGQALDGVQELTPGIRSLQIHYDSQRLSQRELLGVLQTAEAELTAHATLEVPSRIVHLPLSWDDPATRLAIDKYMQSVRKDAPWCPSNLEFIRRVNGLDSLAEVERIVFAASYLILALGDVYLGAPVATPLDPRHRLVTTKYNPARTWTPENAVGIGGAYLCIYGMEGPGGYQFVGRTVQMWNHHGLSPAFVEGKPWLLRFFDQIRFYPVSAEELLELREAFVRGRWQPRIEATRLDLISYRRFLSDHRADIQAFKQRQQAAFEAERERWRQLPEVTEDFAETETAAVPIAAGHRGVTAPVAGTVWQLSSSVGQRVRAGETLLVMESMKMEIPVCASATGTVTELRCVRGGAVRVGDVVAVVQIATADCASS